MKQFLPTLLLSFCLLFSLSESLFAQGSTTSSMNGRVQDANREELIGATVQAIHQPTGTSYGTITNVEGRYNIRNMRPGGPYTIRVTFIGYETVERTGIELQLGQTAELVFTLEEAATELQEVQVVAGRRIIDGNQTGAETNVSTEQIEALPSASRNITDFVRLSPQANIVETGDGPTITIAGQNNRFNSMYIDGAVNNDVFGLAGSGTNGGQTGVSPISIDAIEQFSVSVSPYDVTLGGFTGGSINAVTRSGTNEFKGSAYYFFRNENLTGKTPVPEGASDDFERTKVEPFTARTYGFRLGGPVVKNKLFFFLNGEIQRDEVPQPFDFDAYQAQGGSFSLNELDGIRNFFIENYGYDPGGFRNNVREQNSNKLLGKLDWNINDRHTLSLRHSYTYAEEIEANRSLSNSINFFNNAEFFPSTTNSTALELNSNLADNISNKLVIGYTNVNDDRGSMGQPFPYVTFYDPNNDRIRYNLGTEQFSVGNILKQDVVTMTNNFTLFSGNHTFTFGTHNEYYEIFNLFIRQNYGVYEYQTFDDLVQGNTPLSYTRSYVLQPSVDAAIGDEAVDVAANFRALQLGFYAQDEWQMSKALKLNMGLRLDIPSFLDDPAGNQDFNQNALPAMAEQYDIKGARSGNVPDPQFLISPRFGFNYTPMEDRDLQFRGGAGIFTGRIPFVWPGGSYTNNGVFLADIDVNNPTLADTGEPLPFRPDPRNQYIADDIEGAGISGGSQVDIFAEDFKFPQVFRSSLAVDFMLPGEIVATLEGIYTKDINAIYYQNVNLERTSIRVGQQPDGTIIGPDNRPVYSGNSIDPDYGRVLLGSNTNLGYAYTLTGQLQRTFQGGLATSIAYTFNRSKSVFDGTSSQNSSNWRNTTAVDKNDVQLGFSTFDAGHRVIASLSYRKEYAGFLASQMSLFYTGQSGDRFSYTYLPQFSGSRNFRAISGNNLSSRNFNDLIYIPSDQSEINLIPYEDDNGNILTPDQQWQALDAFIADDNYLDNNRGNYAEANAGRLPFEHVVDFKFVQDFFVNVGGKRNILQLTFDVFNFTNLLNREWGRQRFIGFGTYSLINFEGFVDPEAGDFTPQYTYRSPESPANLDDQGIISSRWQGQLGVRYIFN